MKYAIWSVVIILTGFALTRLVSKIPADCDDVAETLASFELGNYAEPDERAPLVEKYHAMCKREHVDIDEAACLDKAKTRLAAARCVPRLYPDVIGADCEGATCVIRTLDKLADAMCDCRDKACTDRVQQQMTSWSQMIAQESQRTTTPPGREDVDRMQQAAQRYGTCYTQALAATQ
jgi:hypothetical protein